MNAVLFVVILLVGIFFLTLPVLIVALYFRRQAKNPPQPHNPARPDAWLDEKGPDDLWADADQVAGGEPQTDGTITPEDGLEANPPDGQASGGNDES